MYLQLSVKLLTNLKMPHASSTTRHKSLVSLLGCIARSHELDVDSKPNLLANFRCMTADLELRQKNVTKARSIVEKARLRNPQNPELWRKAILIEWEFGSKDQVNITLSPTSVRGSVSTLLGFLVYLGIRAGILA